MGSTNRSASPWCSLLEELSLAVRSLVWFALGREASGRSKEELAFGSGFDSAELAVGGGEDSSSWTSTSQIVRGWYFLSTILGLF